MRTAMLFLPLCILAAGCLPRVVVKPHPGPNTRGIRYYRPKPYLLISPVQMSSDAKVVTGVSDRYVNIEMKYMPDFSEEYAVRITTGLGTNHTKLTLDDGWNLTSIDADIDSKFADNINAISNLIKAVSPLATPAGAPAAAPDGAPPEGVQMTVKARNVPLGFYESVWARGPDGIKRLYGWRYLGFMPYSQCPVKVGGAEAACCDSMPIYGLVFENDVMVFKTLPEIGQISGSQAAESNADAQPPAAPPLPNEPIPPGRAR